MSLDEVADWLQERYPKPKVDPDWTSACVNFLQQELGLDMEDQREELLGQVDMQLLQSDLRDSMVRQTGFPAGLQVQGGMKKGVIGTRASGGSILVQVLEMMEIGSSAFTLSNVHQARVDKADMTGLTKENIVTGAGDANEGAENAAAANVADEEEDATAPPYPRSMLSLLLNDGTMTIRAMENKRIEGLVLGETKLGFKMLLKGVRICNGIALLEPSNVELVGYQNDELDAERDFNFVNALRKRMKKPLLERPEPEPGQLEDRVEEERPAARGREPDAQPVGDDVYFDDFDSFAVEDLEPAEPRPARPPSSVEDEDMFADEDFWKDLDEAQQNVPRAQPAPTQNGTKATVIIELDDSDEEPPEKRPKRRPDVETIVLSDSE